MLKFSGFVILICLVVLSVKAISVWNFFGVTGPIIGSGNIIESVYPVNNIRKLQVSGNFTVSVRQGDIESLVIKAEDNLLPYVDIYNGNGLLRIGLKSGVMITSSKPMHAIISLKEIEKVSVRGSTRLQATKIASNNFELNASGSSSMEIDEIHADSIKLTANGTSDVTAALNAKNLALDLSGSSECAISGNAANIMLRAAGSVRYKAPELVADNCDINAHGSAALTVHARRSIRGMGSGSVSLNYYGNPLIAFKTFGSSSIQKVI